MLPTPSTSHIDPNRIYEPAEDSYLLLDTLASASEIAFLTTRFAPATPAPLILELGVGSGVVLAFVTAHAEHILGRVDVVAFGTDFNAFACRAAAQTVLGAVGERSQVKRSAGQFGDCVTGDLATALRPGSVDVLIFNPPYVPSEALPDAAESTSAWDPFERDSHLLALSYAGGVDGMETTDRLLAQLPDVLSKRGLAYVLLCKQNRPQVVLDTIRSWPGGWAADIVGTSGKIAGWEKLCVLRIWKP
ncbi:S-adenosylmethionine-dependent methyltransferase [Teratosphaeriaceae sp. CCFEE 6253]|nr:S-adenosylmethionine-dependent methyltransferase [Teratosphaeriaceae sp. CCFEE 6253]